MDWMIGTTHQDVRQIGFRIDQGAHRGGTLASSVGSGKKVVFAAQGDSAPCAFGGIVVDLEPAIVTIPQQWRPAPERVVDCHCHVRFPGKMLQEQQRSSGT
jgi:hypothetical protein